MPHVRHPPVSKLLMRNLHLHRRRMIAGRELAKIRAGRDKISAIIAAIPAEHIGTGSERLAGSKASDLFTEHIVNSHRYGFLHRQRETERRRLRSRKHERIRSILLERKARSRIA